jgi:hypothetical protein
VSVFDAKSRYALYASLYVTTDGRGRTVQAVGPAEVPVRENLGDHLLKGHERLDHLAAHYLNDANGFWRIASHMAVLLPEAALIGSSVRIPREG